jgi:hypothetical protein
MIKNIQATVPAMLGQKYQNKLFSTNFKNLEKLLTVFWQELLSFLALPKMYAARPFG